MSGRFDAGTRGWQMGIQAELEKLRTRAAAGDATEAERAARRAASIRDVLAGARAASDHPDVRAALEDGLELAEAAARELEKLATAKRQGPGGVEAGPASGEAEPGAGGKRPMWPPSPEVIDQAAEGLERLAAGVTSVLGQLAKELSKAADEFTRGPARCAKCGTPLGEARFCPRCGTARA